MKCKNCGHRIRKNTNKAVRCLSNKKYIHWGFFGTSVKCLERDCDCSSPEPAGGEE